MSRNINPVPQFFDNAGDPLGEGEVFYFISGTTTPKDTFADTNSIEKNDNPVILPEDGSLPDVFFEGLARQVLKDKNGVQIWEREEVGKPATDNAFDDYNSQVIYAENDLVTDENGDYYRSLHNGNQNNAPSISPSFWVQVEFLEHHNVNIDYPVGATVKTTDGRIWCSLVTPNMGNDPATTEQWEGLQFDAFAFVENYVVTAGYGITVQNSSGNALVTFDKPASSSSNQAIWVDNLEKLFNSFTDPANFTVNSCLVQSEFLSVGTLQPTDKFTIYRISG